LSARSQAKTAKAEARQVVAQGALDAANQAKATRIKAARIKSSFLQSGLELEGTPIAAINDTFTTGLADTNQIVSNANMRSRNIMQTAKSAAIGSLVSSIGMAAMGGGFGGSAGGTGSSGFSSIFGKSAGQQVGSIFSSSPTGPYQPLGF